MKIFAWIRKHLPTAKDIKENKHLSWFSTRLKSRPYLWQFTKHGVAGGVAVSLLVAFIPLPLEMLLAAVLAILFRVNLPIAVASTWLTNPVTFLPANYLIYEVGSFFVKNDQVNLPTMKLNWYSMIKSSEEVLTWLGSVGKVYLVGLPIVSLGAAVLGYLMVYLGWTLYEFIRGPRAL